MSELRRDVLREHEIKADRVKASLLAAEYRYAKTMPENPHWYTLRKTWADDEAFIECVEYIREVGYIEKYKGRKYTMFNLNGYKYWTMGAPIWGKNGEPCTILINKAKTAEPSEYDAIAEKYDKLFSDRSSIAENNDIFSKIRCRNGDRILDIGCGTGLFLEYFRRRQYIGLDPSAQMLGQLVQRHREFAGNIAHCKFEEFHDDRDGFDLIVSLFGSANYVDPAAWRRVFRMLRPGGRVFAMFYQDDYTPVTYLKCDVKFEHFRTDEYDLSRFSLTPYKTSYLIAEYERPAEDLS